MADIWDALGQIATQVGTGLLNVKAAKQQQKALNTQLQIARYQAKSALPTLGMGYAASPLAMQPGASGGIMLPQVQPASMQSVLGIPSNSLAGQMFFGGGSARDRAIAKIEAGDRPLLWARDLAACKRVAKVARKLGRFTRRRPR